MPPSEAAQRHYEELFPGHVSTLARTDPQLVEIFDNFAFDEVLAHDDFDPRTRRKVRPHGPGDLTSVGAARARLAAVRG